MSEESVKSVTEVIEAWDRDGLKRVVHKVTEGRKVTYQVINITNSGRSTKSYTEEEFADNFTIGATRPSGSKRTERKPRGHIFRGVVKQIFDHQDPVDEASNHAGVTAGIADGLYNWSGRAQRRMAYSIRYFKAVQDTMSFAREAFGQAAEEAIVDSLTDNIVPLDEQVARTNFEMSHIRIPEQESAQA